MGKDPKAREIMAETLEVRRAFEQYVDKQLDGGWNHRELKSLIRRMADNMNPWTLSLIHQVHEFGKFDPATLPKDAGADKDNRAAFVLREIIRALPSNKDWLDPALEALARDIVEPL